MKSSLSEIVISTLDRIGVKAVAKWRWEKWEIASHTRNLLQLLKVDCVLDVGANKGQYANFLRTHVGYEGEILSFEPVQELALVLSERAKNDPLWHVFPCALGAREESLPINVTHGTTLHSFLAPVRSGVEYIDQLNTVVRTEEVLVRTVDSVLKERESSRSNTFFLKLDTQGYDHEVLKGATNYLPRIAALQMEISCIPIYEKMTRLLESLESLEKLGFDVTGMFPVNRDKWLRVVEFDCLAVNRRWSKVGDRSFIDTPSG